MKTFKCILITAVLLAIGFAISAFSYDLAGLLGLEGNNTDLRLEIVKSVWQFLLVVVIGGAVGVYFKKQEQDREQRAARREALLRTRFDLVKAYNKAKAIRRLLRACARYGVEGKIVLREAYNSQMSQLVEAQLAFEYYEDFVESDRLLFHGPREWRAQGNIPEELKSQLDIIEKYLNSIIEEFEGAYQIFAGNDQALLVNLGELREFILEKEDGSAFDRKFKRPFHDSMKLIQYLADHVE